jgi:hypothetical protein
VASVSSAPRSIAAEGPPPARASDRAPAIAVAIAVVGATGLGLWLRLTGLWGWDGTLSPDEARLALAGRAALEHGAPVFPTG